MVRKYFFMIFVMVLSSFVLACGDNEETEPNKPSQDTSDNERKDVRLTRSQQQLVSSSNAFAFNLFREVTTTDGQSAVKSQIVSPISVTYALGMLNNGATGDTQAQINQVLGFGDTGADSINAYCKKMLMEATKLDKLTKVMIANTIFMNKDYELKLDFVKKAKTYYDADPETRDFRDGKTRGVINKWGKDHTEGMIPEVLKEEEFNPYAASYLLNAIYFKGTWMSKFDKGSTKNETFTAPDGDRKVPMMHQKSHFPYTENDICQVLRLPYGNGAYSMTVLLPKDGKSIADVSQTLTAGTWQNYQHMLSAEADVKLPRFESQSDIDLKTIMADMGMPKAFDKDYAEFPNFCNVPTYIGLMKQVARIKLNEEGTEAAAVTIIGVNEITSISQPREVIFHANRPFIYVISEVSTGAIFFIGQYVGD